MSNYIKIESLDQLKELCSDGPLECFVALNGGGRSSKDIQYHSEDSSWSIYHHIDGTEDELTEQDFINSFEYNALKLGALWKY